MFLNQQLILIIELRILGNEVINSELKVLAEVKEYFKSFGSRQIKEFSHKEKAYQETNSGDVISYLYSKELQI